MDSLDKPKRALLWPQVKQGLMLGRFASSIAKVVYDASGFYKSLEKRRSNESERTKLMIKV